MSPSSSRSRVADGERGDGLLGRIREWVESLPLITPRIVSGAREAVPYHPEDVRSPMRRIRVSDSHIEIEASSADEPLGRARYPMSISEVLTVPARHRRGFSPPVPYPVDRAAFDRAQAEAANQATVAMAESISRIGVTFEEAMTALEQATLLLAGSWGEPPPITPEARERARALLRGLLTPGERRVFQECGYVPVIGSESGDLWLVTGKSAYNLIRYERPPHGFPGAPEILSKPFPVTWCAAAATPAPVEDLTVSLIIALRADESRVTEIANRLYPAGGFPDGDGYRRLRELAKSRCRNKKILKSHLKQARKAERPQPSYLSNQFVLGVGNCRSAAQLAVELDPEGAPGQFTTVGELTGDIGFRVTPDLER